MNYELMLIVKTEADLTTVKNLLTKEEVKIVSEEPWGMRRLAYPIQKIREGFYDVLTVSGTSSTVATLSKRFKQEGQILRFLFTSKKEVKNAKKS
jgi:small subunit ribosomal protein S6